VAIADGRAVAFGHPNTEDADRLLIGSMLFDGSDARTSELAMPEFVQEVSLDRPGESGSREIVADVVEAMDATTLPDGSDVAILVRTEYHATELDIIVIYFEPVNTETWDYVLLDVLTGAVVQQARSSCTDPNPPDDCTIDTAQPFMPLNVSVLNGER
jgi:hypothetical protein